MPFSPNAARYFQYKYPARTSSLHDFSNFSHLDLIRGHGSRKVRPPGRNVLVIRGGVPLHPNKIRLPSGCGFRAAGQRLFLTFKSESHLMFGCP